MNVKILSFVILFFVSYLLAIFLAPKEADELAGFLGFKEINIGIRDLKNSSDNFSENIINPKSQLSGTGNSLVNDVTKSIEIVDGYGTSIQQTVKTTRDVIQTKKQQVENLTNTIQKGTEVISELKQNTNALLEFSGSTQANTTMSGSIDSSSKFVGAGSGSTLTGSVIP